MMPGLTLNTEAAASKASRHQSPGNRALASSAADGGNSSSSAPTRTFQSTTPIPVPIPMPYTSSLEQQQQQQQQQPAPQITTPARSASPARPTYSPITPPLNATAFPAAARQPTYTHSSHANATAVPPPPPEPIDFDSNPDVLALKSAISILQMQRKKAERDMATLGRVKGAALAEPEAFIRDLTTGRVHVEGERLFGGGGGGAKDEDSDSSSDSDSDGDENRPNSEEAEGAKQTHTEGNPNPKPKNRPDGKKPDPPPWAAIPKPQNIVRCPPINWSQYAVVGESLDKLHEEQVRRPAQGTPAILTADGRFEFKGGDGKHERYPGVAAPYAPGKDRIDPKSRNPSRR